ncbi:unnamed protein product [Victoria cruziana]
MPRDYHHPWNLYRNPTIDDEFSRINIGSPERVGGFERLPADEAEDAAAAGISRYALYSIRRAVTDFARVSFLLEGLGGRPDREAVELARSRIAEIDSRLSKQLEEIVSASRSDENDHDEWRCRQAEKEKECRQEAEKEKLPYRSVVRLEERHEAYSVLLKEAEKKLEKVYSVEAGTPDPLPVSDEVSEEVHNIMQQAYEIDVEQVVLSGRMLRCFPEQLERIRWLVVLDLSNNQLEELPYSLALLENLQELLKDLPFSISFCRSLIELDASFNLLTDLPAGIGYELVNLQKLLIHLNKMRYLPASICELKSLRQLDAHFNEIHDLPLSIGRLENLEVLNLSSNFCDLTKLPQTIGDLKNLKELDLSNNHIHVLPVSFGRLKNLVKLNLDQNPLIIPPIEVANQGVEAVKDYMAKIWSDRLLEEERRSTVEEVNVHPETGSLMDNAS